MRSGRVLVNPFPGFNSYLHVSHLTDNIFFQSAALLLLGAPAQTWKPKTANMTGLASTAAVANAQIHLGLALLVFLMQLLEKNFGSEHTRIALQRAVASRVSGELLVKIILT